MDQGKFSNGEHNLEVVAFSSNQQSLPIVVQFEGEGEISPSYDFSSLVYVLIAIIGIVPLSIFLLLRFTNIKKFSDFPNHPYSEDSATMDAEIIE